MPHLRRILSLDDDELLRDYRNLTDVALRRVFEPAGGLYLAESIKVLRRALAAGHEPRSVLVLEKHVDEVIDALDGRDTPVFVGEPAVLEAITGYDVHRGILASMHRPTLPKVEEILDGARTVVVLEDIVEHTNVGAIFRSVAALGADAVFVSMRCADPLYRRSVRVSMGTVFQVPWTRLLWPRGLDTLAAAGFHIAALALADDAVELDDFAARRPERVALVLGTEGDGLTRKALTRADTVVRIDMAGGVDSLNVAAAAAVALHALRPARSLE